jgi:hypothetical protein
MDQRSILSKEPSLPSGQSGDAATYISYSKRFQFCDPGGRCGIAPASTACGSTICGTRSSPSWPRWASRITCSNRSAAMCRGGCWSTTRTFASTQDARRSMPWMPPDAAPNGNGAGYGSRGNEDGPDEGGINALVEVSGELTSQSRHSLRLSGSPPHGKLLIPLERSACGRKRGPEEPPRSGGPSAQRAA